MTYKYRVPYIPGRKVFEAYSKLRSLIEKPDDEPNALIKQAFQKGGNILAEKKIFGKFSFKTKEKDKDEYFTYELDEKRGVYGETPIDDADLEIFVEKETLLKIIQGGVSPIEAIGTRKMRVRGDLKLALRMYKILSRPEGRIAPCRDGEEI